MISEMSEFSQFSRVEESPVSEATEREKEKEKEKNSEQVDKAFSSIISGDSGFRSVAISHTTDLDNRLKNDEHRLPPPFVPSETALVEERHYVTSNVPFYRLSVYYWKLSVTCTISRAGKRGGKMKERQGTSERERFPRGNTYCWSTNRTSFWYATFSFLSLQSERETREICTWFRWSQSYEILLCRSNESLLVEFTCLIGEKRTQGFNFCCMNFNPRNYPCLMQYGVPILIGRFEKQTR